MTKVEKRGGKRANAGRPKGVPNKVKNELQGLITDEIVNTCLKNLLKLANGNLAVKKKVRGGEEIFYTEPSYFANAYLLDQKFGKARQRIDANLEGGIQLTINKILDENIPNNFNPNNADSD